RDKRGRLTLRSNQQVTTSCMGLLTQAHNTRFDVFYLHDHIGVLVNDADVVRELFVPALLGFLGLVVNPLVVLGQVLDVQISQQVVTSIHFPGVELNQPVGVVHVSNRVNRTVR